MAHSLKKNFIYNSAYQIFQIITPLVTTPYLSRVLGASGVGVYSYTMTVAGYFVMFATLGMSQYGVRVMAQADKDRASRSRVFWSAYFAQLIASVVALVCYLAYALSGPKDGTLIALLWSLYVLSAAFNVTWLFFGLEEFKKTTLASFAVKLLEFVGIFALIHTRDDVWLYCGLDSFAFLLNQVVLWPLVRRYVDWYRPSWAEVRAHIKPNLALFIPVIATNLYATFNTVLLGLLSTNEQTGFYSYAEKLSKMPLSVITALGTVMLPRMSSAFAAGEREEGLRLIESSMWLMLAMGFALSFGIMGVAEEFVPVFLGAEFAPSVPTMMTMAWIVPVICVTNVIGVQYLLPSKRDHQYTESVCAGAAANLLLCFILIPRLQAFGSAISTVIAEFVVLAVQCWCVRRELPLRHYLRAALPFVGIGLTMCLVIRLASVPLRAAFSLSVVTLLVEVLLGGTIYAGGALLYCTISNNEQFQRIFGSRRRGKMGR